MDGHGHTTHARETQRAYAGTRADSGHYETGLNEVEDEPNDQKCSLNGRTARTFAQYLRRYTLLQYCIEGCGSGRSQKAKSSYNITPVLSQAIYSAL